MPDRHVVVIAWLRNMQGKEVLIFSQRKHFLDTDFERRQVCGTCLSLHTVRTAHQEPSDIGGYWLSSTHRDAGSWHQQSDKDHQKEVWCLEVGGCMGVKREFCRRACSLSKEEAVLQNSVSHLGLWGRVEIGQVRGRETVNHRSTISRKGLHSVTTPKLFPP